MIIYLDTSSLVKLYVEEEGSKKVVSMVQSSKATATSLIAYAEARAAFARRFREKAFGSQQYRRLVSGFTKDWENYLVVRVTTELVQWAGDLAERHGLSGFDAMHLSSALTLQQELSLPLWFSCYDKDLSNAAELEGLSEPG
jgi:predicted nucleic acid-binding protein